MDMAVRASKLGRLLRMAVVTGVESAVQVHISRGDDLDARDDKGLTPLMLAAARNKAAICELLIEAGANARLLNPGGGDALSIALAAGAKDAAVVIAAAGAPDSAPLEADSGKGLAVAPFDEPAADAESELTPVDFADDKPSALNKPRRLVVPLELTDAIDLGGWEAEKETSPPEDDPALFGVAAGLQYAISEHRPVDTSADWDDFEAHLPEQASPLARAGDAEARERLRLVLLRAFREGSVPLSLTDDLTLDDNGSPNDEAAFVLRMVINDLGAETDERFEYIAEHESFEVFVTPEKGSEEEDAVAEALAFIDDLASMRNEPLRIYQKAFQREALISAEAEVALSQAMERAIDAAVRALASWPAGIESVLNSAKAVLSGEKPLRWVSEPEREDAQPPEARPDAESPSEGLSLSPSVDIVDNGDRDPQAPSGEDESNGELAEFGAKVECLASLQENGDDPARLDALLSLELTRNFLIGVEDVRSDFKDESALAFTRAIKAYLHARDKMAVANLKLVHSIAKKYFHSGEPLDDLLQEGNLGLLKAIDRYDWRKGFKFSTYATWWIRQTITRHIADKTKTIRLPVHVFEKTQRIAYASRHFEAANGRSPTVYELEKILREPVRKVMTLARATEETACIHEIANLDERIATHARDELIERDPAETVSDIQLRKCIESLLGALTKKQHFILRFHFGIGVQDSMTLEEIGSRLDVTRERIRQIEAKGMRRLQHPVLRDELLHALGRSIPAKTKRKPVVVSEPDDEVNESSDASPARVEVPVSSAPLPEAMPTRLVPRPRGHRAIAVSKALDEARACGIDVHDDRDGSSKRAWVHLTTPSDGSSRTLVRKLSTLGFEFWPGKGYWL